MVETLKVSQSGTLYRVWLVVVVMVMVVRHNQLTMSINSMRSRNLGLLQEIIQEWIDEYYRMRDNQVRCLFYNE